MQPSQPSRLLANGKFTEFVLTEHSLRFLLEVKTDKKKKKGNGNRTDTFLCEVKRFPSDVNPDSAQFEVSSSFFFREFVTYFSNFPGSRTSIRRSIHPPHTYQNWKSLDKLERIPRFQWNHWCHNDLDLNSLLFFFLFFSLKCAYGCYTEFQILTLNWYWSLSFSVSQHYFVIPE